MILTTTKRDYEAHYPPWLYIPLDPGYLYQTKEMNQAYHNTLFSIDSGCSRDDSWGYGLDALISQRREITYSRIQMLLLEIHTRYILRNENLYGIGYDQCRFRNMIFRKGEHIWDGKRIELERKIIELDQEKRREHINYFRDTLFLKKELREALLERFEDEKKASLFLQKKEVST